MPSTTLTPRRSRFPPLSTLLTLPPLFYTFLLLLRRIASHSLATTPLHTHKLCIAKITNSNIQATLQFSLPHTKPCIAITFPLRMSIPGIAEVQVTNEINANSTHGTMEMIITIQEQKMMEEFAKQILMNASVKMEIEGMVTLRIMSFIYLSGVKMEKEIELKGIHFACILKPTDYKSQQWMDYRKSNYTR